MKEKLFISLGANSNVVLEAKVQSFCQKKAVELEAVILLEAVSSWVTGKDMLCSFVLGFKIPPPLLLMLWEKALLVLYMHHIEQWRQ